MSKKSARNASSSQRRSAARLAAVQALYQMDMTGAATDAVLADFLQHGIGATAVAGDAEDGGEIETDLVAPDGALLGEIVRGAVDRRTLLDEMIAGALSRDWTSERLEAVLRSILRAGAWELFARADIPPRVVISEYVDVAHAFYSGTEPGLVNAVLDRIARVVRPEALARPEAEAGGNGRPD